MRLCRLFSSTREYLFVTQTTKIIKTLVQMKPTYQKTNKFSSFEKDAHIMILVLRVTNK